ncbi:MAG: PLP-dependent aspartate aminotransferase family protein [Candidatus Sumerlaeia bacterium]
MTDNDQTKQQQATADTPRYRIGTRAVHSGEPRAQWMNSITTPIVQTSSYVFPNMADVIAYAEGKLDRYEYGRYGNPTLSVVIKKLIDLEEGAEEAELTDCGMSAVSCTILGLLDKGDHIILTDDAYKKTFLFCDKVLWRFGIESTIVPMGDYEKMEQAIKPNTRMVISESPTNPYLNIADMARLKQLKDRHGFILVIDTTFATPYNLKPIRYGADIVVHSATKYLAGHNDILAGVILGRRDLMLRISDYKHTIGSVLDPHAAYLLLRGLKTFALRMARHNENGMRVATFLERHPKVRRVYYPGLPSHRHYEIAKAQMTGFGGVVTFDLDGDLKRTLKFLDNLRLFKIAPSFGGVESLVAHPMTVSYYNYTPEERRQLGILDTLVRLGCGIEDAEDLIEDLEQALSKV